LASQFRKIAQASILGFEESTRSWSGGAAASGIHQISAAYQECAAPGCKVSKPKSRKQAKFPRPFKGLFSIGNVRVRSPPRSASHSFDRAVSQRHAGIARKCVLSRTGPSLWAAVRPRPRPKSEKVSGPLREYSRFAETCVRDPSSIETKGSLIAADRPKTARYALESGQATAPNRAETVHAAELCHARSQSVLVPQARVDLPQPLGLLFFRSLALFSF
jgi:hypothetical protein